MHAFDGFLPLHEGCRANCDADVIALLIKHWPDALQGITGLGKTPLHEACFHQCDAVVVALLIQQWLGALKIVDKEW